MQFNHTAIAAAVSEVQTYSDPKAIYKWSLEFKVLEEGTLDTEDDDLCTGPREKEGFFSPIFLPNIDFIGDYEKTISVRVLWNTETSPRSSTRNSRLSTKRRIDLNMLFPVR